MPKVSIIIRTKNEERWIGSCLKSIFDQTHKDFEVILVDNNSFYDPNGYKIIPYWLLKLY